MLKVFVLGHYLFLVAHSFPRATLSENCSLLGTDKCPRTNIGAYFRAKWRLLFIYTMIYKNGERMRDFLGLFVFTAV